MGWVFRINKKHGKKHIIETIVTAFSDKESAWQYIDHRLVKNRLWIMLREVETGVTEPIAYDMEAGGSEMGWGYKCLWFTEHDDIPYSLFKQMTSINGADQCAVNWCNRIEALHKEKADRLQSWRALKNGDELNVNGVAYRCIQPRRPRANFTVVERKSDSTKFKLSYENWIASFVPMAPVAGEEGFQADVCMRFHTGPCALCESFKKAEK